jgi:hypothetical protein
VFIQNRHGGINQQWEIVYEWKEPTKGQLNKDFGLYVERPFYVVSQLPKNRYLDWINNNMVIKTSNGYDSQKWFFDQRSRTVKNLKEPTKSWDIAGSGKHSNLQIYNTNSGWW